MKNLYFCLQGFAVALLICGCAAQPGKDKRPNPGLFSAPPKRALLTGVVKLPNGKPVTGGTVRLNFGEKGGVATAGLDADGAFSIGNLPVGKATVAIETASVNLKRQELFPLFRAGDQRKEVVDAKQKLKKIRDSLPDAGKKIAFVAIPKEYAEFTTSGLSVVLKAGRNHHNFTIRE